MLKTRIDGGQPPDLAMLAQPTPVLAYAADGKVIDVATFMDATKLSDEHPATIGLVTQGTNIWGIPYKADVKSTIWYPIKAFEAKGYTVPTTWDELIALSDKIVTDGTNPWCVSAGGPGDATGWQITDWVEEVVLKTKGLDYYNEWISHKIPFQDPGIKDAFDNYVGKIFFTPNYVFGGNTAIVATDQKTPMDPMFTDDLANPKCWMQKIPTWYGPDFFPDQRASGAAVEVRHRRLTSGCSRSRRSTRPRTMPRARPTRSWCSPIGPKSVPSPSSWPRRKASRSGSRAGSAISANYDHPRRLVCRRLQAQGRFRDREQRRGHRLRRFRPHAGQGRRRNLLDPDGPVGQQRWRQYRCRPEGHRRQLAHPVTILMACGARHLTVARPATISGEEGADGRSSN